MNPTLVNEMSGDITTITVTDKPINDFDGLNVMADQQKRREIAQEVDRQIAAYYAQAGERNRTETNHPSWTGVTIMTAIAVLVGFVLGLGL